MVPKPFFFLSFVYIETLTRIGYLLEINICVTDDNSDYGSRSYTLDRPMDPCFLSISLFIFSSFCLSTETVVYVEKLIVADIPNYLFRLNSNHTFSLNDADGSNPWHRQTPNFIDQL